MGKASALKLISGSDHLHPSKDGEKLPTADRCESDAGAPIIPMLLKPTLEAFLPREFRSQAGILCT